MTCDNIYDLLSAKLDGELSAAEETQLQAHLDGCQDCRRLYDAMFAIEKQTKALEQPAPEGLKRGIMYRIKQQTGAAKAGKRRFWGVGTGLGLVAAALVMMVGAGIIKLPKPARSLPKTENTSYMEFVPVQTAPPEAAPQHVSEPVKTIPALHTEPEMEDQEEPPAETAPGWEIPPEPTRQTESQPYELPELQPTEPAQPDDPVVTEAPQANPEPTVSEPFYPAPETEDATEPVRRPIENNGSNPGNSDVPEAPTFTESEVPAGPESPEEPFLETEQPITEELNAVCLDLSETCEAPVLLYSEFSFESMLYLLEQEEPELFEALTVVEPLTLNEFLFPTEDENPDGASEEISAEDSVVPPVVPDWAMPGADAAEGSPADETDGVPEDEVPEPLPPEERIIVCATDYQTLLALHEWMLQRIPRTLLPDLDLISTEYATSLRMEELDPDSQSLRRIITWDRPTGPVTWPEFWAEDWVMRFRTAENWALYFPDTDYTPEAEDLALLVFLKPLEEEPIPEPEAEIVTEPETASEE